MFLLVQAHPCSPGKIQRAVKWLSVYVCFAGHELCLLLSSCAVY